MLVPLGCSIGGGSHAEAPPPQTLGAGVDEITMTQEVNAEASKYVVYAHEFEVNHPDDDGNQGGWKLNSYGEDHVKRIAANLLRGDEFPVIVERSRTSLKAGTKFKYPNHFNESLDQKRRQMIVAALSAMGVPDADGRVVVAPAFAEGLGAAEAARAYFIGLGRRNTGRSGAAGGNFGRGSVR